VFSLAGCNLLFIENFKYLGHVIDNCLNDDSDNDSDIMREVKNLFVRSNLLCRRFRRCSLQVKLVLFRSFVSVFMTLHYGQIFQLLLFKNLSPVIPSVLNTFLVT